MGLFINTNVASINARRRLNTAQSSLGRSFERLSSGLRINSAKDDAAGLAISNRFTSQIRGLNQAVRNSNDAISLSQTAEGALDETSNILQRMRELSVQAANDTNTLSDRESLQAEVDQLLSEMTRIAETTTFNGQNILDGSFTSALFQVGANARETIGVTTTDARTNILGRQARTDGDASVSTGAIAANDVVINSVSIRATVATDDTVSTSLGTGSAIAKAAAINDSSAFTGVQAIVGESTATGAAAVAGTVFDSANNIVINGSTITGFTFQDNDADNSLVDQINAEAATTGVTASLDKDNQMVLTALDGRNIEVEVNGGGSAAGVTAGVYTGSITLQSANQITITSGANGDVIGNGVAGGTEIIGVNSNFAVDKIGSGGVASLTSRLGANTAIEILDVAIGQVSDIRADYGAIQNRLESTINNLSTTTENLSASRARIMDADFAEETATLSKNQIMQQAGTSILAQANQSNQIVLSLLG